jgi:hypothetical protein
VEMMLILGTKPNIVSEALRPDEKASDEDDESDGTRIQLYCFVTCADC